MYIPQQQPEPAPPHDTHRRRSLEPQSTTLNKTSSSQSSHATTRRARQATKSLIAKWYGLCGWEDDVTTEIVVPSVSVPEPEKDALIRKAFARHMRREGCVPRSEMAFGEFDWESDSSDDERESERWGYKSWDGREGGAKSNMDDERDSTGPTSSPTVKSSSTSAAGSVSTSTAGLGSNGRPSKTEAESNTGTCNQQ